MSSGSVLAMGNRYRLSNANNPRLSVEYDHLCNRAIRSRWVQRHGRFEREPRARPWAVATARAPRTVKTGASTSEPPLVDAAFRARSAWPNGHDVSATRWV